MSPVPFRTSTPPPRRLLTGIVGEPPEPPRSIVDDPAAVEEWFALWALDVAAAWTPAERGKVALLASLRSRGGVGSRNVSTQARLEGELLMSTRARRHAGVMTRDDVVPEGVTAAGAAATRSQLAPEEDDASGLVVFGAGGVVLEAFGRLTDAGRRVLDERVVAS